MHFALESKLQGGLHAFEQRLARRTLPVPVSSQTDRDNLVDFTTNDYLSLTRLPALRNKFLQKLTDAPNILGSGGSRLLVNGEAHAALEKRLAKFFNSPIALIFNSGYHANVGFFSCVPQPGDVIVYDEYVHASVHDGMKASRVEKARRIAFKTNSVDDLRRVLLGVRKMLKEKSAGMGGDTSSVFVSVEALYSMDGTIAPLTEICDTLEELFPAGNAYLIVDEAHSAGIYGPQGRGRVAQLALEHRVLVRLVTFGKALGATGAVLLTNELIRDYLIHHARSFIFTTSLSYSNIIAADASFDLLMDGTGERQSARLQENCVYLVTTMQKRLSTLGVAPKLLSIPPELCIERPGSNPPSPILPLLTSQARALSDYLRSLGIIALHVTWPAVPMGEDRVRVSLQAGHTREDIDRLVKGAVGWALQVAEKESKDSGASRSAGQRYEVAYASKL